MALYYVRSHKRWLGIGGHPWVNSYEIVTQGSSISTPGVDVTDVDNIDNFILDLIAFERAVHLTSVYFERVVVSTWIPDSNPYNGNELMSRPQGTYGLRTYDNTQIEDLRFCLGITRVPILGNPGKLPFRGVLTEADKESGAQGIAQLTPTSTIREEGLIWIAAEGFIENYYAGGVLSADVSLAMIHSPTPETYSARGVVNLVPLGVTKVDLTHKYFDVP